MTFCKLLFSQCRDMLVDISLGDAKPWVLLFDGAKLSTRRTRRGLCLDFGFRTFQSLSCALYFLIVYWVEHSGVRLRRLAALCLLECTYRRPENGPRTQRPQKTRDSCFVAQVQHIKAVLLQFRSASRNALVADVHTS